MLPFYRGVAHAYLVEKLIRAEFSIYSKGRSNQCPTFLKHLQNTSEFVKLIIICMGIFSWIIINIYNISEGTFQLITRQFSSTDNIQISYKSYKYSFKKIMQLIFKRFQTHQFMAKRKIS